MKRIRLIGLLEMAWGVLYFLFLMFFPSSAWGAINVYAQDDSYIARVNQRMFTAYNMAGYTFILLIVLLLLAYAKNNEVKLFSIGFIFSFAAMVLIVYKVETASWICGIVGGLLLVLQSFGVFDALHREKKPKIKKEKKKKSKSSDDVDIFDE